MNEEDEFQLSSNLWVLKYLKTKIIPLRSVISHQEATHIIILLLKSELAESALSARRHRASFWKFFTIISLRAWARSTL